MFELAQENLNEPSAALTQQYDAIFCVGLLYHLRKPAEFLARAAQATSFCGFPPSFAPNRKRPSSKATIAVAFSAKLLSTPAGRSGPAIFSADDRLLGRHAVGGRI